MTLSALDADGVIRLLDLSPHPEGGFYRQTWQAPHAPGARSVGTCIYFLLRAGDRSHWHHVDATEIWHYYAGTPLILSISATDDGPRQDHLLGPDLASGARPQVIVPKGHWQSASPQPGAREEWTLVGCTVSPGFQFEGFTLADPGFKIP